MSVIINNQAEPHETYHGGSSLHAANHLFDPCLLQSSVPQLSLINATDGLDIECDSGTDKSSTQFPDLVDYWH